MQQFGFDEEEHFNLQFPYRNTNQPYGVMMQGGKATALGQNPKFRIIEIDSSTFLPVSSTLYEYKLDQLEVNSAATDLIQPIHTYPTSFTSMSNLSPSQFKALAEDLKNDETKAIEYLNNIKANRSVNPVTECDAACREDLYCRLVNSNQQDIMKCRGLGFMDPIYGLEYAISQMQNPWVQE